MVSADPKWLPESLFYQIKTPSVFQAVCSFTFFAVNTDLTPQVMRRAQSNSPRMPPKKYHSFKETRDINLDNLLLLPGYKPRPRPPSYPAHVSPVRDDAHVPRIRITCVPEPDPEPPQPVMRRQSPDSRIQSSESRGRSPGRRVSQRISGLFTPVSSYSLSRLTH